MSNRQNPRPSTSYSSLSPRNLASPFRWPPVSNGVCRLFPQRPPRRRRPHGNAYGEPSIPGERVRPSGGVCLEMHFGRSDSVIFGGGWWRRQDMADVAAVALESSGGGGDLSLGDFMYLNFFSFFSHW